MFVVWKTVKEEQKKRLVVGICKLNNIVIHDSYLLSLQSEIMANLQGCTNLELLDVTFFLISDVFTNINALCLWW